MSNDLTSYEGISLDWDDMTPDLADVYIACLRSCAAERMYGLGTTAYTFPISSIAQPSYTMCKNLYDCLSYAIIRYFNHVANDLDAARAGTGNWTIAAALAAIGDSIRESPPPIGDNPTLAFLRQTYDLLNLCRKRVGTPVVSSQLQKIGDKAGYLDDYDANWATALSEFNAASWNQYIKSHYVDGTGWLEQAEIVASVAVTGRSQYGTLFILMSATKTKYKYTERFSGGLRGQYKHYRKSETPANGSYDNFWMASTPFPTAGTWYLVENSPEAYYSSGDGYTWETDYDISSYSMPTTPIRDASYYQDDRTLDATYLPHAVGIIDFDGSNGFKFKNW